MHTHRKWFRDSVNPSARSNILHAIAIAIVIATTQHTDQIVHTGIEHNIKLVGRSVGLAILRFRLRYGK